MNLLLALVLVAIFPSAGTAQVALDDAPDALPIVQLASNARHTQRNETTARRAHRARDKRVIRGREVRVEDRAGSCDLVVDGDGHLRLENCWLRLRGNLFLKDRGILELVDCRVQVENTRPREFGYWWEGGELRTRRCLIGGVRAASGLGQIAVFQLNRGRWIAKDTTVQYSGGILLGEGREGFAKDPFLRGGTLIANGLHQGRIPDALILSGTGDAILRNSTFSVHLFVYAGARTATSKLDFTTDRPLTSRVYGDKRLYESMPISGTPINRDLPGLPYRLEVANTRVPFWFLSIFEVRTGGPVSTFELENTSGLTVGVHAENLKGRPRPTGRWQNDPSAPELPAVEVSGQHEIPPACGVQIGNANLIAPARSSARVSSWSFYLRGLQTDFAARGPTKLAEIVMLEGRLRFEGRDAYDARLAANTINLHRDARLELRNVSLGPLTVGTGVQGSLLMHGVSSCSIDGALIDDMRFESRPVPYCCRYRGVNATKLDVRNFIVRSRQPIVRANGSSQFRLQRSTPSQAFDLSNLDFDRGIDQGKPAHWSSAQLTASTSSDRRPWTSSQRSLRVRSTSAIAWLSKRVPFEAGCEVQISAWVKPLRNPAGARLQLRARGARAGAQRVDVDLRGSEWRKVRLPAFRTAAREIIDFGFDFAGAGIEALLDDVEVRVTSWWDDDNFLNLDFERGTVRGFGFAPTFHRCPDYWQVWDCDASVETRDLRPGARSGSKAIRCRARTTGVQLYKVWRRLAPGTKLRVTGYMKVVPNTARREAIKVHVGEDSTWWNDRVGNNKLFYAHDGGNWTRFQVDYQVPARPQSTRLAIVGGSRGGDEVLVDDVRVEILP